VTTWVISTNPELVALLRSIAERARVEMCAVATEEALERLRVGDLPDGVLVEDGALTDVGHLGTIPRVVIATPRVDRSRTRLPNESVLRLPASLAEIERTLTWLSSAGAEHRPPARQPEATRSRRAPARAFRVSRR